MHIRVLAEEKDGVYYLANKDQVLKEYEKRDVNLLSGGEQRRVTLAGLILKKCLKFCQ